MPRTVSRSIRYVFVAFAGGLLLLAGVQSLGHAPQRMGIATCGWDEKPCLLDELVVKAPAASIPVAEADVALPVQHVHTVRPHTPDAQS